MFKYLQLLKQYGNFWNYFYIFIGVVSLLLFILSFVLHESFDEQYVFLPIAVYFIGITFYRLKQKSIGGVPDYQERVVNSDVDKSKGFFYWFPLILFLLNIPLLLITILSEQGTERELIITFHGFMMFLSLLAIAMTLVAPNRVQYTFFGLIKLKNKVIATYFIGCILLIPTILQIIWLIELIK